MRSDSSINILGIVTARGGSKGIPGKNIRLLCGKPLLWYTAKAALTSRLLTRVVLSTDDERVAEVGLRCGLEVPFRRPADLARDDTPTLPVLQHAVRYMEEQGDRYDAICLLQPTHPLRTAQQIDACIELFAVSGADAVMTVLAVPEKHNPHWVYFTDQDGHLRLSTREVDPIPQRQQLPPAYHREGSIYITRRDVLIRQNTMYGQRVMGFLLDQSQTINIDTWEDLQRAEQILSQGAPC
jgi:CMP-N-acetylneuraminic acid synthetase